MFLQVRHIIHIQLHGDLMDKLLLLGCFDLLLLCFGSCAVTGTFGQFFLFCSFSVFFGTL